MITDRDLVALQFRGSTTQGSPVPRSIAERWLRSSSGRKGGWDIIEVPACICCGDVAWPNRRCTKHQDRNPCVVEGCRCTRAAKGYLSDDWFICSKHWRAYVPPGSPERMVYLRFFRLAKRMGFNANDRWPRRLQHRFNRYWAALVQRVRRQSTEGRLDQAEIAKMFGWDKE